MDPYTRHSEQLTWTVLPQGFRDSPHIFGQVLAQDLKQFHHDHSESTLLQYVDNLLLCSPSWEQSQLDTASLLNLLASRGFRVSPVKAQISSPSVTYLGFLLSQQRKSITLDRKRLLSDMPIPKTKTEILSFLGLAGYFRAWIPNFSLLARPLYDLSKGPPEEPLPSSPRHSFIKLCQALVEAPALHLPDLSKPFSLYIHERSSQALGVLGQYYGPSFAPVAYLSKQLDPTVRGRVPCLRALAAGQLLQKEAHKLTFGAPLTILSTHHLKDLLTYKSLQTLPPSRLLTLLSSFLQNPDISFLPCPPLNLATLLPLPYSPYTPSHDCLEALHNFLLCHSTISKGALSHSNLIWFTDGSSFKHEGTHYAGYAVVSLKDIIEAQALPPGTTNQQAKLIAATRACTLAQDTSLTLYTDSKYVFHILLSHAAVWKE
ncbi:uncharacterized protein LOC130683860 [Manis pentadactyla]|uniref:uncharacterized protein LOC130683860 n=1 Tax=Manis pentadactyla TaxID=143292 RepID=UPI00255CA241|nr:uncharacterized protein LOC130683860 [Manis pentadactyla]